MPAMMWVGIAAGCRWLDISLADMCQMIEAGDVEARVLDGVLEISLPESDGLAEMDASVGPEQSAVLLLPDAARSSGRSVRTIHYWLARGEIVGVRLAGRRWHVLQQSLEARASIQPGARLCAVCAREIGEQHG